VVEDAPLHCGVEEWRAACGARASTSVGLKMAMQDRCLLSRCTFALVHVAYYESGYPNQVKHVKYFTLCCFLFFNMIEHLRILHPVTLLLSMHIACTNWHFSVPLHPRYYDTTSLRYPLACSVGHLGVMAY